MSRIAKALEKAKKGLVQDTQGQSSQRARERHESVNGRGADRGVVPQNTLARFRLNLASFNTLLHSKNRVIVDESSHNAMSAYNMLRTRVAQRMRSNNWHRLAISSASASDGKTLTAINLGISMARPGDRRVVLLDFDLQNPSVSRCLGIGDVEHYLSDYIAGRAKPEQVLHTTPVENLWIIPNDTAIGNSSETLASKKIVQLLDWLQEIDPHCVILMDLPPLLVSDDVLVVSPLFDALLLILAEGRTTRESARNTRELIEDHDIELLGTVLNKSSDRMASYQY